MSIEVRIPKEITEYKEKILFGLSIRQLICFSVAIVLGVSSYLIIVKLFPFLGINFVELRNQDIASYVVILEVMPIFAIGFIKINGFTFEKYVALMIRHKFGTKKRTYINFLETDLNTVTKRGKINVTKKTKANHKKYSECEALKISKKDRKRKSKEAIREIKRIRKEK